MRLKIIILLLHKAVRRNEIEEQLGQDSRHLVDVDCS